MTWEAFWAVFALVWTTNVILAVRSEQPSANAAAESAASESRAKQQQADRLALEAPGERHTMERVPGAVREQNSARTRRSEHLVEHWPLSAQLPLFPQLH